MPIPVSAGSATKFAPAPAGVHQAVCVDVVDLGVLEVTYKGQTKKQHKVNVVWQINESRDDGKPFLLRQRYTASLHEKAALRRDIESWRGRKFTDNELHSFDLETLLGANCLLNVTHNESGGNVYANVSAIMPLAKGMPKITGRDYTRVVDRPQEGAPAADQPHGDDEFGDAPHPATSITDDDIPF